MVGRVANSNAPMGHDAKQNEGLQLQFVNNRREVSLVVGCGRRHLEASHRHTLTAVVVLHQAKMRCDHSKHLGVPRDTPPKLKMTQERWAVDKRCAFSTYCVRD